MRELWDAVALLLSDYWWVYLGAIALLGAVVWRFPRFRRPVQAWLSKEIVMPRWAILIDGVWRVFLTVSAITVLILWYQSATRDEEADRNARIQSCSSVYAATYSAWDAEGQRLFGQLVSSSAADEGDQPIDPALLVEYTTAESNAAEMARLRIGLGMFAARSVEEGNEFACPPVPARLMIEPIDP